jgi:fatty acid synthase subunit alpha
MDMQQMMSMMSMMQGGGGNNNGGGGGAIPDAPVTAKHALAVLLAVKFNKNLSEIGDGSTIKALSGGKSAVQNEVVGDLSAEFGGGPDTAAEMPLSELASKFPGYSAPGKVMSKAVAKMLAGKLPGSFGASQARQYLADARLLGEGRVQSVLMHALVMPPADRLADAAGAQAWLDAVCDDYGTFVGVVVPRAGAGGGAPMMPMMMMGGGGGGGGNGGMGGEMAAKLFRMVETQAASFDDFLGRDRFAQVRALEQEEASREKADGYIDSLHAELGEPFCEKIQPQHDAKQVRSYDSYWNWVVQDALDLHCHVLAEVLRIGTKAANGAAENWQAAAAAAGDNEAAGIYAHYAAMAAWITAPKDALDGSPPPQAWFRNYLCNRATPELLALVQHFSRSMHDAGQNQYAQAITLLAEQVRLWIGRVPVHLSVVQSMAPHVRVSEADGTIEYYEEPRDGVDSPVAYVEEMSRGLYYARAASLQVQHPSQGVELSADAALHVGEREEEEDGLEYDNASDASDLEGDDGEGRWPRSEMELMDAMKSAADAMALPQGPRLDAMRRTLSGAGTPRTPDGSAVPPAPAAAADAAAEAADGVDAPAVNEDDYAAIHVAKHAPFVHMKSPSAVDKSVRIINERLSSKYLSALHDIAVNGVSFADQVALVTGAGSGSIAEELVKALLEGGATVVASLRTSRGADAMAREYSRFRKIYEEFGAKGSRLVLEPANCASAQDMVSLVAHVYDELGLDVDFVIPFAASPENGKDIGGIDSSSEAAHRMMLTNVVRLVGEVKKAKEQRGIDTRPALVLLPCSPNHGEFGNDGLYAESKLGVESLVNKWGSEGWSNYVSIAAAVIGWTRSALMKQNNIVAPGVEALGCRTFSPQEMVLNFVGLLHPKMVTIAAEEPLWADLTGNWVAVPSMTGATRELRLRLREESRLVRATVAEAQKSGEGGGGGTGNAGKSPAAVRLGDAAATTANKPLARPHKMGAAFPVLPETKPDLGLEGMVDLRKVVVVVGYGEVGPWGNAKTRWEMESAGQFSLEGAIELAWIVGLIKPWNGPLPGQNPRNKYIGWLDVASGQPVADHEVKRRFEPTLLKHCGVRVVEPELFEGYDPEKKTVMAKVAIDRDMQPVEVATEEEGRQYQREVGVELVDVFFVPAGDGTGGNATTGRHGGSGQWMIRVKAGAVLIIPKALRFDRNVCGQVPTGFDAKRLGVPPEIADSVDPVTLFALVSTVEALVNSGLTDPYELYQVKCNKYLCSFISTTTNHTLLLLL